jgi:hypothetical protein
LGGLVRIHVERIPSVGDYFDDALDRLVREDEVEKIVLAARRSSAPCCVNSSPLI